ncbi:glutamate-5-semialdehyde dehydrogenase [Persicobacter psychrovividus]|uniref:Gamma-glutamyl phosphate reductase n=1 Tax=Persicobacter psychrovividus TaxID=387638 RepID=A0ABM7VI30_9BACT|nr:gamma-glutamyl phosphate reductase [Persicobacter psychrovividus]
MQTTLNQLDHQFELTHQASKILPLLSEEKINQILLAIADRIEAHIPNILTENQKDLARMAKDDPKYDRLLLNEDRLRGIASDMRSVAALPSPVGEVMLENRHAAGMVIQQTRVPFGLIGVIYEARPNVTYDVFALCFKSSNACILKGGSDAIDSNTIGVKIIQEVLAEFQINPNCIQLLPTDREATKALLNARDYVDLIIPRGSQNLINFVRENANIPVIETGAGICHTYFAASGTLQKGQAIIKNAKTRRVSVCNALDCLLMDQSRLSDLPALVAGLADEGVSIYADAPAFEQLEGHYPAELLKQAQEDTFGTEFLDYKMAIKTVADPTEALAHIQKYSSKHSEAIVAEDQEQIEHFLKLVDAAAVYANVSTAFTDGAEFGLGAEIGISTQKLHARGPMGLLALTTYKWMVRGDGQVR